LEKKSFLSENKHLIWWGPAVIVFTVILLFLYEVNVEYGLYFIFFCLISWLLILYFQWKKYRKDTRKENIQADVRSDFDEQKWLAVKEKEDFFTLWTHQIKTPIAALNLILQSESPDIRQCKLETFKIESYVEMALNYLRFDTMGNDLVLKDYELDKMVKAVVKKLAPIFINKHLSITLGNLDFTILTDDKWFSFVLEQIISNAVKYTKEGGVTVSAQKDRDEVILCVADTGMGIRKEDIPRLFEKGFTGYNGRMDKKASGLGLYLCRGVSAKLGHELWVESEENKGTQVYIKIKSESINRDNLSKM